MVSVIEGRGVLADFVLPWRVGGRGWLTPGEFRMSYVIARQRWRSSPVRKSQLFKGLLGIRAQC